MGRAWRQRRALAMAPGRGVRGTRPWFAARWGRADRRVGAGFVRADRCGFHSGATAAGLARGPSRLEPRRE